MWKIGSLGTDSSIEFHQTNIFYWHSIEIWICVINFKIYHPSIFFHTIPLFHLITLPEYHTHIPTNHLQHHPIIQKQSYNPNEESLAVLNFLSFYQTFFFFTQPIQSNLNYVLNQRTKSDFALPAATKRAQSYQTK